MRIKCIIFIICNFMFSSAFAQNKQEKIPFIFSESPKYSTSKFITLKELHKIDVDVFKEYFINEVRTMDVDSDTNLYVLDYYESKITVFNKNGKFMRTMCGKGQGPSELMQPMSLSINDGKMYIYEKNKGMKILDLYSKYIDYILIPLGNYYMVKALDDFFLTVDAGYDIKLINRKYIIKKFSKDLKKFYPITDFFYKPDPNKILLEDMQEIVSINSKQQIYFPGSFEEYKINIYSIEGNILKSFGRKYKQIPYSEKITKWRNERAKKNVYPPNSKPRELTKYPPVIRDILFDDRDYAWVVVGEWGRDCDWSFNVISTVDVFDENCELLYTFQIPNMSFQSFIKNGRLYSTPTQDDTYIHVYNIQYNK